MFIILKIGEIDTLFTFSDLSIVYHHLLVAEPSALSWHQLQIGFLFSAQYIWVIEKGKKWVYNKWTINPEENDLSAQKSKFKKFKSTALDVL